MRALLVALVLAIGCGSNNAAGPTGSPDAAVPPGADAGPDLGPDVAPDLGPDLGPDSIPDAFVDPLIGTWIDEVQTDQVIRFKFDGTNWELDLLFRLTDGTYGMDIKQGTYIVTSSTSAKLRIKAASCQGVVPLAGNTLDLAFDRNGNALSTTIGTAYLVFQLKSTPPSGMGAAIIGCFKSDGAFVEHATAPVP